MKTIKILMLALLAVLQLTSCSSDDDDVVINPTDLPAAAQTFLNEYFNGLQVTRVEKDDENGSDRYDVYLADGTEVEFDQSGAWTDVDCKTKAVPAAIVPEAIGRYVADNYASLSIVQIERESYGYDIELSDGLDIQFDRDYNVIRVGD